tara:strand:+ start:403 stop:1305 length:903 start_codon:yes stop_codon:yes gene_type:complete
MMTLTFRLLFLLVILYSISFVPLSADENPEINLWPAGAVPDEPEGIEKRKKPTTIDKVGKMRIAYVDKPSITVYKAPKDRSNGTSVIIFPGGGYNILAWTHEGTEIAEWLNSLGVSAFVLKYRVPRRDPEKPHTLPLQDAQRAIRIVRSRSKEWGIDPGRIGVLGFSAGGHLAVMSGTHYGDKSYERIDDADDLSSRPDFLIPIYPAYLGDRKNRDQLSGLVDINKNTPPMFIAITHDDSDRAYYSALLYAALKKSGVVGELHIYSKGGHGYGMRKSKDPVHTWPDRCADWLGSMGLLGP